jgi:hypothetical protein
MGVNHDFFAENQDAPADVKELREKEKFSDSIMEEKPDFFSKEVNERAAEAEKADEVQAEKGTEALQEANDGKIETKNEVATEASPEADEAVEELEEALKELAAFHNDNEYKMPADAKFKHKVDKEEIEVSLQELLNNYSGKQSWDKKFSELDKDRQEYKQDLDYVNKYISEFAQKSKDNPVDALEFLAEAVGINPFEYRKQLRTQLIGKYQDYLTMDDSERKLFEQREELEYLRRSQETEAKKRMEQQTQWELENKFRGIQQTHGIDNDRRDYLAKELQEVYKAEVTPENMLELHSSLTRLDRVDKALEKINPEYLNDDNKVLTLESLLRGNPGMSDTDLFDTASKLYGNDVQKAVANLTRKTPVEKEQPKEQKFKPRLNSPNNIDFF